MGKNKYWEIWLRLFWFDLFNGHNSLLTNNNYSMQQQQQIEQPLHNMEKKGTTPATTTTTAAFRHLSKQSKTLHNQQLLNDCQSTDEQSKIPVVRAQARLVDLAAGAATIPPMRSSMRLQHHMLLRGRSRIRHHRRNCGNAVGMAGTCTSVTARYYRDVSGIPRNLANNNYITTTARSASATLDANSNPLPHKEVLGARFSAPCNNNNNDLNNTNSSKNKNNNNNNLSNNNNNYNDDSLSDNSCSISSTSSISRPIIRRHFNANLSSTDTNPPNRHPAASTSTSSVESNNNNNNNNRNKKNPTVDSGSSSGGSCSTTVSAIKRNKRSLSSTRIEKDKCDEYNTKLLRKTTPPMVHYSNKNVNNINNNNNTNNNSKRDCDKNATTTAIVEAGKTTATSRLTRTRTSCHDVSATAGNVNVSGRGGSFKEHNTRAYATEYSTTSSASTSTTTSSIPTPTSGLNNVYLTRHLKYADDVERQKQQQLCTKLRKKVSY